MCNFIFNSDILNKDCSTSPFYFQLFNCCCYTIAHIHEDMTDEMFPQIQSEKRSYSLSVSLNKCMFHFASWYIFIKLESCGYIQTKFIEKCKYWDILRIYRFYFDIIWKLIIHLLCLSFIMSFIYCVICSLCHSFIMSFIH